MNITLICQHESGEVNFSPARIQGIEAPGRRYWITGHQIVLAGYDMAVLHHDADELLSNPVYRMLTPAEQEAMAAEQAKARQIQEEAMLTQDHAIAPTTSTPSVSEQQQEKPPDEPKPEPLLSLSTKKKNGGG